MATCPKGHEQDVSGPFCAKDGGEFKVQSKEVPTPEFWILAEADGIDVRNYDKAEWKQIWDAIHNAYGEDAMLHSLGRGDNQTLLIGKCLGQPSCDGYERSEFSCSKGKLRDVFKEIEKLRDAMGFGDGIRSVGLYVESSIT